MPAITYQHINYRNENRILVQFAPNTEWNKRMRKIPGVHWSKTYCGWTIPDTMENRAKCGLSNTTAVETLVLQKQTFSAKPQTLNTHQSDNLKTTKLQTSKTALSCISANNKEQLIQFLQQLQLKAYSPSTIRTYRNEFAQLLKMIDKFPVQNLEPKHLQRYLLYCIKNGLSEHGIHSRLNALKFYFEQVLKREKFFFEIPRPKRPEQLPKILNEDELKRMFAAVKNLKHKAILFTAYSAGLRVSEVVNLRIRDIDSKRMQIFVQRAKGKKDRVVNLSVLVLDVLRQYIKQQITKPQYYLFTGPDGLQSYSERSAQKIFQEAKKQAGIYKDVTFHSLRHSFATHLLEKGIDVKYIKELLGHFDIRTTERYLHVRKEQLVNILSPLDSLYEEKELDARIAATDYTKKRTAKY